MNQERQFPKELLSEPISARKSYFESKTIGHPNLVQCTEKLVKAIKNPDGYSILLVMGPTGVGKTTLIKRVAEMIINQMTQLTNLDIGCIPIVSFELPSPDSGSFNWKDYYTRALVNLCEPLIDYKIDYDKYKNPNYKDINKVPVNSGRTAPELRRSLENALINRKPVALIIDEAQHFAKMASGRRLQDQLDTLKSFANLTKVIHVLVGNYELNDFVDLSGQLSRRTMDIHFERYKADNMKDVQIFKSIIYTFQQILPVEEEPDLLAHWEYMYERTIGCVGILKDWLVRSLGLALEDKSKTIDLEVLQKTALPARKIEKIATEIFQGESTFNDSEVNKLLRIQMGLNQSYNQDSDKIKESGKVNDVGKRNPVRDKIGVLYDE